jgi:hypothetical protein
MRSHLLSGNQHNPAAFARGHQPDQFENAVALKL